MDNFENQDLGGLPILKKETPSQEKDLGGLPILKKKRIYTFRIFGYTITISR
jgi:hypothetical protein